MAIRNRELSQFASFTWVDDINRNIGLSTQLNENIGIGTTTPIQKLHVYGDSYFEGDVTIDGKSNFGNLEINTSGVITAFTFYSTKFGLEELVNPVNDRWQPGNGFDIYRLNGNVGLGISNPAERLHIIGNINATRFISTVATGTAPFIVSSTTQVQNLNADRVRGGIPGNNNSGDIITTDAAQTLFNKTINSTVIQNPNLTGSITFNDRELSSPANNGVIITSGDNGTVTSQMIANNSIVDSDINTGAGISYTKLSLNNSIRNSDIAPNASIDVQKLSGATISGILLGENLNSLTIDSTYLTGGTYNGSVGVALSINASAFNLNNFVVARDSQGNFSANTINLNQNLNANSGTVSARGITVGVNGISVESGGNVTVNNGNLEVNGGYIIGQTATLHIQDQKSSGSDGGTFTQGSWIRRTLNVVISNNVSGSSLSSDQITLIPGTYEISASVPGYAVDSHQARFISSSAGIVIYGTSEYANQRSGPDKAESLSRSMITGQFTIANTFADFQLEHRCSNSKTTNGFGLACNFGNVEVYSDLTIRKIS
jgi:hypothetical protein